MSYDYNELVAAIASSREQARASSESNKSEERLSHLQHASEAFSTLSSHCPMTPLLWMQYASDTMELLLALGTDQIEAQETQLQLLELGLSEFPGSAPMHVHYLRCLFKKSVTNSMDGEEGTTNYNVEDDEKVMQAIESAISNVGMGSHRNEGELVASIYRMAAQLHQAKGRLKEAVDCFCKRAGVPMRQVNDTITAELQQFCSDSDGLSSTVIQEIDASRRLESKIYASLVTYENEIDLAMHAEGILYRHQASQLSDNLNWSQLIGGNEHKFWMGFGGLTTANAFIKYAQACARFRLIGYDDENIDRTRTETKVRALCMSIYERGIAECPTVEALWLSYLRHLIYLMQKGQPESLSIIASRFQTVVSRAVRNCPYSLDLYKQKLESVLLLAELDIVVFDPDRLMNIVKEAIDTKFIVDAEVCAELYRSAIQTVKRRILSILSLTYVGSSSNEAEAAKALSYDDAEPADSKFQGVSSDMDESTRQDVQDLCEDIREMYDAADAYLRKNHNRSSDVRAELWFDRGYTEQELVSPLMACFSDDGDTATFCPKQRKLSEECMRCIEKVINVHKPTVPRSFMTYLQTFTRFVIPATPGQIISKLRQTRALYQRAIKEVGKPKKQWKAAIQSTSSLDCETDFRALCQSFMKFERTFGSEKSLNQASKTIQKKLEKLFSVGRSIKQTATFQEAESGNTVAAETEEPPVRGDNLFETGKSPGQVVAAKEPNENGKRPLDNADRQQASKKSKLSNIESVALPTHQTNGAESKPAQSLENVKPPCHTKHKVRIGRLDYPAHPFTVRVSHLSQDTEDMDLVDCLSKSGAIVHARIVREKHHRGKGASKGWGFVQFEERKSVEEAMKLSEVVSIRGKLIKVERSNVAAVGLVPHGMHRLNNKTKGKSSERILRRSERTGAVSGDPGHSEAPLATEAKETSQPESNDNLLSESNSAGVLSFRPRGVRLGRSRRKLKLDVSNTERK